MSVQAYPLQWPQGFPRSKTRERGRFQTGYDQALANVVRSLKLFGDDSGKKIESPVLSTNRDMLGRYDNDDPGVAVWFTWDGIQVCIPVDRYDSPSANLQAIHHIIEARRVELRHGTLALVRATFTGFKALPAPAGTHWRDVLGLNGSPRIIRADVETAYKRLAQERHPDKGGSDDAMADLNRARDMALREVGQ